MQACHQDKIRFNILDGESSVVWPSSLLPGLESKCCEGKGGLPSVVTHLNAKDAFLTSSLSFCAHSSTQFLQPPFFILMCHYSPLSSSHLFSLPSFFTYHPFFALLLHLSPPPLSHSSISSFFVPSPSLSVDLKVRITSVSFAV